LIGKGLSNEHLNIGSANSKDLEEFKFNIEKTKEKLEFLEEFQHGSVVENK